MRSSIVRYAAGGGIIAGSVLFAVIAFAQSSPSLLPPQPASQEPSASSSITFPIAELGGCTDQTSCHAYCNVPANMQTCTAFAESHGLESSSQAQNADQFAALFAHGGAGPGGCDSPDACDAYCSTVTHLDACIAFAKSHHIADDTLSDAEKVQTYLKGGGAMPGGCNSKSSCQSYCSDQDHMQVCMAFAQKAGLNIGNGGGPNDISAEELQKFAELLQSGKTPNGCATLQACLSYCNDPSHGAACSTFGEDLGVQGNEQVVKPGPGGCTSDATCKAYCSDPSHAAECQAFAHQSNYVQGSSTSYGNPDGCGENNYWNGSQCVQSQTMSPGGTPPPCPEGQICNFNEGGGPQPGSAAPPPPPPSSTSPTSLLPVNSFEANIVSVFGPFIQALGHVLSGNQ